MKVGDTVIYNGIDEMYKGSDCKIVLIGKRKVKVEFEDGTSFFTRTVNVKEYPLSPVEDPTEDITRPAHYHQGGIDVIGFGLQNYPKEQMRGFYRVNILKYIHRYDIKNGMADLIKAKDYLDRLMKLEGEENEKNSDY